MRFKKLIAAGASFLLVVGASTLGAAAAYADDAPVTDPVVTETTPDPVVEPDPAPAPEPDPAPAPEPVVETVPEPVVEPEPAPEPVVEPTTDPVESDPPSTESDSDPPADTSSDFTSSSSDSGDTPTTFSRTTSTLKTGFAEGGKPEDTGPPEGQICEEDGEGWTTKVNTTGDPETVLYTAPDGFLIDAYCVKAGSESSGGGVEIIVVDPPAASIEIDHPDVDSVSHWQVHLVAIDDADIVLEPDATGVDETCSEETDEVVGGSIQLDLSDGAVGNPVLLTYVITGPNGVVVPDGNGLAIDLPAGTYNVTFGPLPLPDGYITAVASPIVIEIGEPEEECGDVNEDCTTTSTASLGVFTIPADEECPEDKKVSLCHATAVNQWVGINISVQAAYNGHVAPPNNLNDHLPDIIPPFTYYVQGNPVNFLGRNFPYSGADDPEWLAFFGEECGEPEEVTPAAQAFDQTCVRLLPDEGYITVTPITGVTYNLTGPSGSPDYGPPTNDAWDPLLPGDYEVHFTLNGVTTNVANPIELTIHEFEGICDPVTLPGVTPSVLQTDLSCLGVGSYTLINSLNDPLAIEWTVAGNQLGVPLNPTPTTFSVTSPGTILVHAEANGPTYGLEGNPQVDWTLEFTAAEDCDLATLALTGQSPNAFIGGAMVLILTGLAMFRLRTARREKMTLI